MFSIRLLLAFVAIFALFNVFNAEVVESGPFNFKSVAKSKCRDNNYLDTGIRKYPVVPSYFRPNACGQPLQMTSSRLPFTLTTDTDTGLTSVRAAIQSYTLKTGQTIDSVAALFDTTPEQILKINPKAYAKPELIQPGYTLKVGYGLCPERQVLTANTNRTLSCPTGATLASTNGWVGPGGTKVGPFVWKQELVEGTTDIYTFKATNVGKVCETQYLGVATKNCKNVGLSFFSASTILANQLQSLVQWQLVPAVAPQTPAQQYLSDTYECVEPEGGVPGGYTFTGLNLNQFSKFPQAAVKAYFAQRKANGDGACTDGSIPNNKGTILASCSQVVAGTNYALYIQVGKGQCADGTKVPAPGPLDATINQSFSKKITVLQVKEVAPL